MNATGVLVLSRTKPLTTKTSRDEFQLQLHAYDRISHAPNPMVESYRITWTGAHAQAFWDQFAERLVPGQPLRVCLERIRSHATPRGPEIHATVHAMGLAPRATQQTETEKA